MIAFLWLNGLCGYAQVNRYMVFFTDKEGTEFTESNPEAFLSQRAIQRRTNQEIPIIENDLPVNREYVDALTGLGIDVYFTTKWLNGALVEFDEALFDQVLEQTFVKSAELVAPGPKLLKSPDNEYERTTLFNEEVNEIANLSQNNMLGVDRMHQSGFYGGPKLIAVFDAGFVGTEKSPYFTHLFDQDKILGTYNFVENGTDVFKYDDHGTGVLSTISAYKEGDYIGVAFEADVVLCITEDYGTEYRIEEYNWLMAAEYADSIGVDIINTSLGYNLFDLPDMNYTYEDLDGNTAVITRATDLAASKGIICVVSVGNEGNNSWGKLVAPADADTVIAVGAVNETGDYVNFSSTGPSADGRIKPDVSAMGSGTKLVDYTGGLSSNSGTSFAAPLIAGLAAGVWEAYPELNNYEVIEIIRKGSSEYFKPNNRLGYGIPNFRNIQNAVTAIDSDFPDQMFRVYPNPANNQHIFIESRKGHIKSLNIHLYDLKGKRVMEKYIEKSGGRSVELDLSGLGSGVFILELTDSQYQGSVKILIP